MEPNAPTPAPGRVLPTINNGKTATRYNSADATPIPVRESARLRAEKESRRRASEPPLPPQSDLAHVNSDASDNLERDAAAQTQGGESTAGTRPPARPMTPPVNTRAARAQRSSAADDTSALAEDGNTGPTEVSEKPPPSTDNGSTSPSLVPLPSTTTTATTTLPVIASSRGRRSRMLNADPLDPVGSELDESGEIEALKKLLQSQSARLERRVEEVGTSTTPIPYGASAKSKSKHKKALNDAGANESASRNETSPAGSDRPLNAQTPPEPRPLKNFKHEQSQCADSQKPTAVNSLLGSQESELTELNMTGTHYGAARKMQDYNTAIGAAGVPTAAAPAGSPAEEASEPFSSSGGEEDTWRSPSPSSASEASFDSLDDESTAKAKKAAKKKARAAHGRRTADKDADAATGATHRKGRRNTATPSTSTAAGVQSGARYFMLEEEPTIDVTGCGAEADGVSADEAQAAVASADRRRASSSTSVLANTQRPHREDLAGGGDGPTTDAAGALMDAVAAVSGVVPATPAQRASVVADPELQKLTEQMEQLQLRMARRASELQRNWEAPQPSTGVIVPADPSVFAATSDEEIQRKAMSAESFAKNQSQWRRNRLRASVQDDNEGGDEPVMFKAGTAAASSGHKPMRKKGKKKKGGSSKKRPTSSKSTTPSHTPPNLPVVVSHTTPGDDSLESSQRPTPRQVNGGSQSSGEWNAAASGGGGGIFGFASLVNDQGSEDSVRVRQAHHFRSSADGGEDEEGTSGTSGSASGSFDPKDPRHLEAERDRLMAADDAHHQDANENSMISYALGRMSMASCSIARVTDGAMAMMELLANRPDVILPAPEETALVRQGDVLSAKHVLKVDLQDALLGREGPTGIIASAPYFRIVPKLNVAGVAQANVSAIHTIIHEFRRAHVDGPIVWVNLREEPLVYINNAAHIVRERVDPLKPIIIPNITGRGIEAIEYKLKQEILQEATSSGGNISTYVQTNSGMMEDQWEYVDPASVFTLAEVFRDISKQYNPIEGAFNRSKNALRVEYFRRPITQNVGPRPEDFDFVLDACLEEPKGIFVFNCQTGRGRTSAMMMIASIVRFYQWCVKDIAVDVRVLRSTSNKLAFRTIQKLVSLFPDGKLHERRLNILMDMADKVYSMADHINEAFLETDAAHAEIAMMRLQQYAYLLVFSYFCEQRLWNYTTKLSFTDWLAENSSLKVLINSVREKLDDQLRDERIGTDDAGDDAEAARVIRRRHGNVLSAGRILCSMPMPAGHTVRQLRQLAPDTPIFTCGRMGEKGRGELVAEVRSAFPKHRMVHWLSLRAEPMVLINDVSYTLAEYSSHLKGPESMTTMHVSLETIEQLEDRLRRDVLLESQENGGTILLHSMNEQGERTKQFVRVRSVRTSKNMMDDFAERTGVAYHRVPIPFSGQMLATDVDPLLRYLARTGQDPDDIVILADSEGSTRTTAALNILTLYRASRLGDLRSAQSPSDFVELLRASDANAVLPSAQLAGTAVVNPDDLPDHPVELLLASTICQMLTAGTLLHTVDAAISLGGKGKNWNILHMLDFLKRRIGKIGLNKPQCVLDALHGLRCYLLVLLTALYLDDAGNYTDEYPFSKWVEDHTEVSHIIDSLPMRGEAALRYISTENLMKADLSRRHGDVLTANFCLKADHFPGCQKKGLRPVVCGAPNFRKVAFINVFGVAIPTRLGIHNILSLLGASSEPMRTYPGERNDDELFLGFAAPRLFDPTFKPEELAKPLRGSVVWVNLREEPILYVGDKPCVFRDLERPYVNVELTGIQTSKIEQVESQLMDDVLNEAQQYDQKFLIHDEGNPGELVGKWEKATESTIKTVRNIYDDLSTKGIRVRFLRLPVTDEQSPDIEDFDALVEALLPRITEHLDRRETLSFVFNCQMGRGRTTTGMVICSLLIGLVTPEYYDELHNLYNPLYRDDESELSKGEYQVITQLKRVLTNGRQSKYKVDLVLEACSRMQNLRTAIEAFAIQLSSPDLTEQGRAHAHHAGVHYLIRYFNIIVFSVYLEECYDRMRKRMRRTFREWMASHPELTTLCASAALN